MDQKNPFFDEKGNPIVGKEKEFDDWVKQNRYIEKLEEHLKSCKEASDYSVSRFDILIITLSSSALAFSMGFIKDIVNKNATNDICLLKISWILFGASLIENLLSQVTSYYCNKYEIKITKGIIRKKRGIQLTIDESHFETIKSTLDHATFYLNAISLFSLIIGIIILVIFTSSNF